MVQRKEKGRNSDNREKKRLNVTNEIELTSGGNGGFAFPASKCCQLIQLKNSCDLITSLLSVSRQPRRFWCSFSNSYKGRMNLQCTLGKTRTYFKTTLLNYAERKIAKDIPFNHGKI